MSMMPLEEHDMKNGYDKNLIKRLFSYSLPYLKWIILSLVLLVAVVGLDLVRPLLIGNAIDQVISNYQKEYVLVENGKGTQIGDQFYALNTMMVKEKKTTNLPSTNDVDNGVFGTLIHREDASESYFFVPNLTQAQVKDKTISHTLIQTNGTFTVTIDGAEKVVFPLTVDQLKTLREKDLSKLYQVMWLFMALTLVGLVVNYFQTLLLNFTGQKIIYNIRDELFTYVQGLSVHFFNDQPVGKIVTRITNDTETLNEMFTSVIANTVKSLITLVGIAVMMMGLDWQLTLATFIVIPLVVAATQWFRAYSRKSYREVRTWIATINAFLSEHISGMKIVQIFGQEKEKYEAFDQANAKLLKANLKQMTSFSIFRPAMYLIYIVGLCVVILFGGHKVLIGVMTIGTLVVFTQYISNFFDPIQQLAEQFNILQSAMAAAEKIFSILDSTDQVIDAPDAIELQDVRGEIEFRNVWFAYEAENWVLRDISFKVEKGETVAFVGATGAGKTSILNLLSRYYEIQKGEILLDGINIQKIKKESIRQFVGQMQQDVFLFTGDIASNIRLKNTEISDEAVMKAATHVNAHTFIEKLPNKYQEHVYERGATLSAGQRQLLSFARTLAFDPKILILDEATANIDTETEQLIQDALVKLMAGRTTLVVAHRLSTIQHAHRIIVLHKGKIREEGNHQSLLAQKGHYYNLYRLQYQEN